MRRSDLGKVHSEGLRGATASRTVSRYALVPAGNGLALTAVISADVTSRTSRPNVRARRGATFVAVNGIV